MRTILRFASAVFAAVTLLLGFTTVQAAQLGAPFGANANFDLRITNPAQSKADTVHVLNTFSDKYNAHLVLLATTALTAGKQRNVFYFGSTPPADDGVVIDNSNKIQWLANDLRGVLRSSAKLGSTPLSGTYYLHGSQQAEKAITEIARDIGAEVQYQALPQGITAFLPRLSSDGVLISWLVSILLILAGGMAWFVQRYRVRCIQTLGGVSTRTLHLEAGVTFLRLMLQGIFPMVLIGVVFLLVLAGPQNTLLVLRTAVPYLLGGAALALLILLSFSAVIRPSQQLLATRVFPRRSFTAFGLTIRAGALVFTMLTLPATIMLGQMSLRAVANADALKVFGNAYQVQLNTNDYIFSDDGSRDLQQLLSTVPDSQILLNIGFNHYFSPLQSDELGKFDDIVLVNEGFLRHIGLQLNGETAAGTLRQLKFTDLPPAMQKSLHEQLSLWVTDSANLDAGFSYYDFHGNNFWSFGHNPLSGESAKQAQHPLVVVVSNLDAKYDYPGFVAPIISSGNILFTSESNIAEKLRQSSLQQSIFSADRVSDISAMLGQQAAGYAGYYLLASVIALLATAATAWQSALIWATAQRKRIFIQGVAGERLGALVWPAVLLDSAITFVVLLAAAILAFILETAADPGVIVLAFAMIMVVYLLVSLLSHRLQAAKQFARVAMRRSI